MDRARRSSAAIRWLWRCAIILGALALAVFAIGFTVAAVTTTSELAFQRLTGLANIFAFVLAAAAAVAGMTAVALRIQDVPPPGGAQTASTHPVPAGPAGAGTPTDLHHAAQMLAQAVREQLAHGAAPPPHAVAPAQAGLPTGAGPAAAGSPAAPTSQADTVVVEPITMTMSVRRPGLYWVGLGFRTDEHRAVLAAWDKVDSAFTLAVRRLLGSGSWFGGHGKDARRLAEVTGDRRWLVIGANIEQLGKARASIEGYTTHTGMSRPSRVPTPESAYLFGLRADTVVRQIHALLAAHQH